MLDDQHRAVRRSSVATRDLEVAEKVLRKIFPNTRAMIDKPDRNFEFVLNHAETDGLSCRTQHWGFSGRAESEPTTSFAAILVQAGGMTVSRPGRPDAIIPSGSVWLYDSGISTRVTWDRDSTFASVHLTMDDLRNAGSGPEGRPVQFVGNSPVDEAAARYWKRLTHQAYGELTAAHSAMENSLLRAHLIRTLAEAALVVFPNTTLTATYLPGPGHAGPASVRRAVEHMHAHAASPIRLGHIAEAAGTSPRALQAAFLRTYDCTPMSYLRQLRLERAHRDLQAASPDRGDTVAVIARRWGFSHLGRFAIAYHRQFLTHPSVTLRA